MANGVNELQIVALKVDLGFVTSLFQVLVMKFIEW